MNKETAPITPEQRPGQHNEALHERMSEQLKDNRERAAEQSGEKNHEQSAQRAEVEAKEAAISGAERSATELQNAAPADTSHKGAPTKAMLNKGFNDTMTQIRGEMKAPSRAFSKVIHAKPVEKASEAVGATVARPNALLAGGIGAFVLTLAVYLVATHFGYRLSGFESIGAFILGWIAGMLVDYARVLATGKRI